MIDVAQADGTVAAFVVDGVQKVAKVLFPASAVYGNVPYPSLRLVTCGGPFDAGQGQYPDNIVVYAHLIGTSRADPARLPALPRPAFASPPRGSTLISRYCKLDADGSTKTGTREAQDDDRE